LLNKIVRSYKIGALGQKKIYSIVLAVILFGQIVGYFPSAIAQESSVPEWVKNNAMWWVEGNIETSEYVNGLEFLIEQQIIRVPSVIPTVTAESLDLQGKDQDEINNLLSSQIGTLQGQIDTQKENFDKGQEDDQRQRNILKSAIEGDPKLCDSMREGVGSVSTIDLAYCDAAEQFIADYRAVCENIPLVKTGLQYINLGVVAAMQGTNTAIIDVNSFFDDISAFALKFDVPIPDPSINVPKVDVGATPVSIPISGSVSVPTISCKTTTVVGVKVCTGINVGSTSKSISISTPSVSVPTVNVGTTPLIIPIDDPSIDLGKPFSFVEVDIPEIPDTAIDAVDNTLSDIANCTFDPLLDITLEDITPPLVRPDVGYPGSPFSITDIFGRINDGDKIEFIGIADFDTNDPFNVPRGTPADEVKVITSNSVATAKVPMDLELGGYVLAIRDGSTGELKLRPSDIFKVIAIP